MNGIVLYQKGSHITDIGIQYKGRICIMSGGVGGEHCTYIEIESEPALLRTLQKSKTIGFKTYFRSKNLKI